MSIPDIPVDVYVVMPAVDVAVFAAPDTQAGAATSVSTVRTDNSDADVYGFRAVQDVTIDSQLFLLP